MKYTDDELRRWWRGLSISGRVEILDRIEDLADSQRLQELAARMKDYV